jgi:multiple sugar transport system ATP-binding protein
LAHIRLENLTKRFGRITAVQNLTLEIRDKEFFVLLGPTGAGKTTTLRCIAGLEKPEYGSIFIDFQNVVGWTPAERDVALVFQYFSLYPHYTVRQNLEFPLKSKIRRIPVEEMNRRVARVSQMLRIEPLLDRRTDKLSGGEMQRVAIGRAMVRDPRVFLMDEPLSHLDAKLREILRTELKNLQVNLGATFLFVTHDQVEAMTMGDRIGVLNHGEIIQVGTPYDVYHHPKNTYVATFIGTPAMNVFDAVILGNRITVVKDLFALDLEQSTLDRMQGLSGEVKIGIRSEDIQIHGGKGMKAHVYGVENMGMERIVSLNVGDYRFKSTVDTKSAIEVDSEIRFAFDQEKIHFFHRDTGENLLFH